MQVKVKDGTLHIPINVWEKAHLPKDGSYEVEVIDGKIIVRTYIQTELKGKVKTLKESGFIGMWADRNDMADSQEWVREQRAAWKKRGKIGG